MAYASAYKFLSVRLHDLLAREGVAVGNTAGYPRVELHDFTEAQPGDKTQAVRIISVVLECISTASPEEAAQMNADNLALLDGCYTADEHFRLFGYVPTQLTETTEAVDTAPVLYRALQTIDFYIQQL